jgi:hypothetical protein
MLEAVLSIDAEDTQLVKKLHAPYEIPDFSVSSVTPAFMYTITARLYRKIMLYQLVNKVKFSLEQATKAQREADI